MKSDIISSLGKMVIVIISPKLHNHEENGAERVALPANRSSSSVRLSQEGDSDQTGTRACADVKSPRNLYMHFFKLPHWKMGGKSLLLYWLRLQTTCANIRENVWYWELLGKRTLLYLILAILKLEGVPVLDVLYSSYHVPSSNRLSSGN